MHEVISKERRSIFAAELSGQDKAWSSPYKNKQNGGYSRGTQVKQARHDGLVTCTAFGLANDRIRVLKASDPQAQVIGTVRIEATRTLVWTTNVFYQ